MAKKKQTPAQKAKAQAKLQTGYAKKVGAYNQAKQGSTRPAYGTYDPSLDQQERAAKRGLGDLIASATKTTRRNTEDLNIGSAAITNANKTGSYDESLADLLTQRDRAKTDFSAATTERKRQYGILANHQAEATAAAGVLGGAIAQAQAKRDANQSREQSVAQQALDRFSSDSSTAETRLGEQKDTGLASLTLANQRGFQDLYDPETGQVTLAQREFPIFKQDTNELRIAQAKQAGLLPSVPKYPTYPGTKKVTGKYVATRTKTLKPAKKGRL